MAAKRGSKKAKKAGKAKAAPKRAAAKRPAARKAAPVKAKPRHPVVHWEIQSQDPGVCTRSTRTCSAGRSMRTTR